MNYAIDVEKDVLSSVKNKELLIENLWSSKISLVKPIRVYIEHKDGECTATNMDTDLYGVGDTEQEAIKDLSEQIEELFYILEGKDDSQVNDYMKQIKFFLRKIIIIN